MVNGAKGIACGWSTEMFNFSLSSVISYIKWYLNMKKDTSQEIT